MTQKKTQTATITGLAKIIEELSDDVRKAEEAYPLLKNNEEQEECRLFIDFGKRRLSWLFNALPALHPSSLKEAMVLLIAANQIMPNVENSEEARDKVKSIHYSALIALEAETGKNRYQLCGTVPDHHEGDCWIDHIEINE